MESTRMPGAFARAGRLSHRVALAAVVSAVMFSSCAEPAGDSASTDSTMGAPTNGTIGALADAAGDPVKRGEMLVTVGGCNDCHTPFMLGPNGPQPDMTKMLSGSPAGVKLPALAMAPPYLFASSGTAFIGPWGTSYARNLTPDSTTGIGSWSADDFVQTIKRGIHKGEPARPIMPPMPWQNYAQMPDEDLRAVYTYLRSVPAIVNMVPDYEPPAGAPAPAPADTAK